MNEPIDLTRWPLSGLVHCGFCEAPMHPSLWLAGPRAYQCAQPCVRSRADTNGLELMAYRTAIADLPQLGRPTPRPEPYPEPVALFAQTFQVVVVHRDLSDVRFIRR